MTHAEQHVTPNRRPLTSRSTGWARSLTSTLTRAGVSPNAISVFSVVFAVLGATSLLYLPRGWGLFVFACGIQARLLCNLLDGMVAIEGGRRSATGALYNEIPDRVADSLFIVTIGYVVGESDLGWLGALAAAVTAYVRVLGGSLGLPQDFRGPMAKQQRMAVLTAAALLGIVELRVLGSQWALVAAVWIVAVGSVMTCGVRTAAIARALRTRQ
jgi:phosphatidylglycerophosphate synthase